MKTRLTVRPCSARQRAHGQDAATEALIRAYAREAELLWRLDTTAADPSGEREPVLADDVQEILRARDWALARLQEWT